MLTDVKHIKKSVLCAQGSFVRSNATYEQTADLSLCTCFPFDELRNPNTNRFLLDTGADINIIKANLLHDKLIYQDNKVVK